MCEKCFNREIKSFPAYWDFDEFYDDFTRKFNRETGLKSAGSALNSVDIYECQNCQTIWWLSRPDLSWRGFFLKENTAKVYLKELAQRGEELAQRSVENWKKAKKGCLLFILFTTIVLLVLIGLIYFILFVNIKKSIHTKNSDTFPSADLPSVPPQRYYRL
jgi:hypothetical protein